MPNYLSSIGFPVENEQEYDTLALRAVEMGDPIPVVGGSYLRWRAGNGVELWAQMNERREIIGLNPHFSGQAVMNAGLVEWLVPDEDTGLDGGFYAWADPKADRAEDGLYPFIFDAPDFGLYTDLTLPAIRRVQLAAFAEALDAYATDEAFSAAQRGEEKLAPESFIPTGLMAAEQVADEVPQAFALLAGRVLKTARLMNHATSVPFHWARIRTLGGEVDAVVDPALLNGTLVEGGVVHGSFWLSGRLLDEGTVADDPWRRLLGR